MTLATACTPRVVIIGNGTLGPYSLVDSNSVAIRFVSTSHVKLTRYAASTDDNNDGSLLVLNTDYTVGGTQDARTFTLIGSQAVLTSSQRIVAERVQSYTQDLDLTTGGAFNASSLESRFDKLAEFQQELKAQLARKISLQYADSTTNVALPSPPTSATQVVGHNTSGELVHVTPASLGTDVALGAGWETLLGLPTTGILDNLSGVRFVANNAALTALTTASGLTDNGLYQTRGASTERDGGQALWVYDSASTASASSSILAIDGGGAGRFYKLDAHSRTLDDFTGDTDTAKMQSWIASSYKSLRLTRGVTITAEIAIPDFYILYLDGFTITKGYNGNMFTMGQYSRILNGRIDGEGSLYTGNGITIAGGVATMHQGLVNVDIINTVGYNVEFSGDFSGLGFYWVGGTFYRYDPTLDAIKLPDTESGTSGLRYFAFLSGNGSAMMDVSGGRVTTIHGCNAASMTLRDTSAYVLMDESRIVQLIDRPAVTGATKANPCVITAAAHGFRNGDSVTFYNIGGMTEINGNNYTVANVTTNTFELSGTNSSAYTTYTSGGYAKNRSAHCIRGSFHQIQGIQGTTIDGSTVLRIMPAAANVALDVHPGQTLQDDSGVTSNRALTWPDKNYIDTAGRTVIAMAAAGSVGLQTTVAGSNNFSIGTNASGSHTELATQNGVDLRLGVGTADDIIISTTAITNGLAMVMSGDTTPVNDNSQKMGTGSKRFSELFAGNGTVNTSDATTKTPLEPIPESVKRAMRSILGGVGVFQFLDSVARKGADKARLQIGVTAQDVRDAFAAEGEDAGRWSLFCCDPIFETIQIEEDVREFVPVDPQKREITDTVTVNEEGRVVVRKVKRIEEYFPDHESVPVVNDDGSPVLNQEGKPFYVSRPKHEWRMSKRTFTEQRRKINEDGSGAVLLGLRPDQLFWLALASLQRSPDEPVVQPPKVPAPPVPAAVEWPDLNEKLSDWDEVGHGAIASNIPAGIAELMEPGETLTHDVRRKLTERLNVELAELKNLRGLAGEDLKREAEIEKLLGLFARLGEI